MKINKIFLLFVLITFSCSSLFAGKLEEYEKELEKIKHEQQMNSNKLQGIDREIANIVYDMVVLDGEIGKASIKLDEVNGKLDEINKKIEEENKLLQSTAQEYNAAQEIYITRLKIIYENGLPNMFEILFSSESIVDFFSKMNVYNSILEYDKLIMNNMKVQKEHLNNVKKNIEIQRELFNQLKYDAEKTNETLENSKKNKEDKINSLKNSKDKLNSYSKELAKQKEEASKKIQEEIEKMQSQGTFNGMWVYPVPGFNIITTKFGYNYDPWNTGHVTVHSGVDIGGSGINGSRLLAMGAGKVAIARNGWNYGYGNYVVIDHGKSGLDGNKYKTLYGHLQSIAVSPGQIVDKGQLIGYVGSSGNSTGPHLHLELYKNNVRMNALEMFKGMKFIYR